MNQGAEGPFVKPKAGGAVEAEQPGAAGGADALFIERECVLEWRAADGAEIFGVERDRGVEAGVADRDASPLEERLLANPAIVGKEQRKKSVGDPADELESSRSNYLATREGSPPGSGVVEHKPAWRKKAGRLPERGAAPVLRSCSDRVVWSAIGAYPKPQV
jgi:hypothetical protein